MYHTETLRRLAVIQKIALGHRGSVVFRYRRKGRRILQFKLPEVKRLLTRAITRRERGYGLARSLARRLSVNGSCSYELWNSQSRTLCGIYIKRTATNDKAFRVHVWGIGADKILARLNEKWERALVLQTASVMREMQRKLAREKPLTAQPRLREDKKGTLKRQFRKSATTWDAVLTTICTTTGKHKAWINRRLQRALDERNIALIRVKNDVFQVVVLGSFASSLIPIDQPVEFWMSRNSERGVYRKNRNRLRQALKRERKEKLRVRAQIRTWREQKRRLRILVAIN